MKVVDKVFEVLGYSPDTKKKGTFVTWEELERREEDAASDFSRVIAPITREFPSDLKTKDYLAAATGWVYACVSVISDEIGSIDIHLYEKKKDKISEVYDHDILTTLYGVNRFTTKFDHFWLTQMYLELTGEAPWAVSKDKDGIPRNLFLLRPDKLTIKHDAKDVIGGYKYEPSPGNVIPLESDSVVFLKYPNPLKPLRGRGTLEAAATTYNLNRFSEEWNTNFFYNSARPDALLTSEGELSQEQIDRLQKQWKKNFKGVRNSSKMAILEGGLQYNILQLKPKDMEFLEQQKFGRDKILSIFRVPKPIIAITDNVNRASALAAKEIFARWTIKPKMERLVSMLNESFIPMFPDSDGLFLGFENPVKEDEAMKVEKYGKGLGESGWMTINEVRERENLPPVEGGDSVLRTAGLEERVREDKTEGEEKSVSFKEFPIKEKYEEKYPREFVELSARKVLSEKHQMEEALKKIVRNHILDKRNGDDDIGKKDKSIQKENIKRKGVKRQNIKKKK